jgi:hypothetical protein
VVELAVDKLANENTRPEDKFFVKAVDDRLLWLQPGQLGVAECTTAYWQVSATLQS